MIKRCIMVFPNFKNIDVIDRIRDKSRELYTGILEKYQSDIYKERYCPHLTVGNLDKKEDYKAILGSLEEEKTKFTTYVNCVSVEIIGDDESSKMEMLIPL